MKSPDDNESQLEAWLDWKRACTIEKCQREHRATLAAFARSRFGAYASKFFGSKKPPSGIEQFWSGEPEWRERAFYELEQRLWKERRKDQPGERIVYKDWLFEKAAADPSPLDVIQGYCTTILKTAVRECCAMEGYEVRQAKAGLQFISWQGSMKDKNFDAADLLLLEGGGVDEKSEAEFHLIIKEEAQGIFSRMSRRDKVGMAAKHLRIPLSDPRVTLAAGCGKSVLSQSVAAFEQQLVENVKGDRDANELLKRLRPEIAFLCHQWKISEMGEKAPF